MAYCADADVVAAGAPAGSYPAQIAEAKERIDRFTGDTFETTPALVVVTQFGASGVAVLPRRFQAVTQVQLIGPTGIFTTLDPSAYVVRLGGTPGDVDAIELMWGYDDLIVGAERWNGGFLNLGRGTRRIQVTGTGGYTTTPATVKTCAAKLAAWLVNQPQYGSGEPAGVTNLAVEGMAVTYDTEFILTTGLPEVDRMLLQFSRNRRRFS
jgi:hypothetical protein